MEWTVLSYALLAIFVSVSAKPEVSPSEQGISMQPDPAAVLNSGGAVSKGVQLMLHVFMKEGDSQLKEPFKLSQGHLEEQIKDGDSLLRERISKGMADVREELKEGDDRLREEVAEVEAKVNQTMEWKEDYDYLEHRVKEWKESTRSEVEDFRKQISAMQLRLNDTETMLQSVQAQLNSTQADLQATQEKLRSHGVAHLRTQEQPENSNSSWCPDGWTSHEGFCFFISTRTDSWFYAKVMCELTGGYLAEDSSTSRHQFLTGLIDSKGFRYTWIGLHDLLEEGVFFWSHSGQRPNVTFWGSGEPDDVRGSEHCVYLSRGYWYNRKCEGLFYHFICEKPASKEMIG